MPRRGQRNVLREDGTWVDHTTDYPAATRTFAVITTGSQDKGSLFMYQPNGSITDITASVSQDAAPAESAR